MAKNYMEITIQKINAAYNVATFKISKADDAYFFLFIEVESFAYTLHC
jgi:hypothetical protein